MESSPDWSWLFGILFHNGHIERSITPFVLKDLRKKIVLISGPRQVGKTTLAKSLMKECDYLNFDNSEHRIALSERSWDKKNPL